MDFLIQPLATNNYLIALANIVTLGTAIYFLIRVIKWFMKFCSSVYNNKLKEFIALQTKVRDAEVSKCANYPSYFIACVTSRSIFIVISGIAMLLAIYGSMGLPETSKSKIDVITYKVTLIIMPFIALFFANSLQLLSLRVRRVMRARQKTERPPVD